MNTIRTKKLITLSGGRWARIGFSVLLTSLFTVGAQAQTVSEGKADLLRNTNKELRTRTWSVYAQGGLSWANGVWYQNQDAKKSYKQSPAVGGGIDFTIRPWIRVGADYIWSRYRREQRFDKLDTDASPAKTYGNYVINTHNVKLGVQFNFMEFWPNRKPQWLNIWMGTGLGGTFARGNEYGIWVGNTVSENGNTKPFFGDINISNDATVTITGKVATVNRREKFDKLFIPATLHIEADVSRQFTLGLKGEMDWLLNRQEVAPKNLIYALATVRYNFVKSRASSASFTAKRLLLLTTAPTLCARRLKPKRHALTVRLLSASRLNSTTATSNASSTTVSKARRLWQKHPNITYSSPTTARI